MNIFLEIRLSWVISHIVTLHYLSAFTPVCSMPAYSILGFLAYWHISFRSRIPIISFSKVTTKALLLQTKRVSGKLQPQHLQLHHQYGAPSSLCDSTPLSKCPSSGLLLPRIRQLCLGRGSHTSGEPPSQSCDPRSSSRRIHMSRSVRYFWLTHCRRLSI